VRAVLYVLGQPSAPGTAAPPRALDVTRVREFLGRRTLGRSVFSNFVTSRQFVYEKLENQSLWSFVGHLRKLLSATRFQRSSKPIRFVSGLDDVRLIGQAVEHRLA
jgi:hypothetical protein